MNKKQISREEIEAYYEANHETIVRAWEEYKSRYGMPSYNNVTVYNVFREGFAVARLSSEPRGFEFDD